MFSMNKTLKKYKIAILIISIIEILLAVAAVLFEYFDWFNFRTYVSEMALIAIFVGLIAVDLFFIWGVLARISKMRQKADLEVASLLGNETQEVQNFGQLGLLVTDENGTILWTNSLFSSRQLDLIDSNVFSWHPELKELVNAPANKVIHLEEKGKTYQVKYMSEPRLFIFKDCTDYDNIMNYNKEQALALGMIMIDNYDDIASETDELADAVNNVRSIITDYFRSFGVLLRRVRNDTYFAVCNFNSLNKMEIDGFSVLEKVRSAWKVGENPLTLSVGFAHNFPDVSKLNEMASSAVNVALSRGGDQAVVSKYGSELVFFGGKTAAVENTSKVKVRSVADSLISLIKSSSNVFVMGHTDLDMDALGSCLGIMAISQWCGKSCKIIYNAKNTEKKTRFAFQEAFVKEQLDAMTISPSEAVSDIQNSSLLVVVDVSRPSLTMAPKALDKASKVIVIDHHRRASEFIERPALSYIEPSASSASELLAMMIRYATANPRIELAPSFATLMLSGIFLDSNYFKSKSTGMRTFEAAEILKEYGADNSIADDYLKDEYEEYALITRIVSTMKTPHYGIVYCVADEDDIIERSTISKVANQLLQLKGVNACFVFGKTDEKTIRISARSDGTVNVQLLCEKMGGGGHFTMAAAAFENERMQRVINNFELTLNEYLDAARRSVNQKGD